MKLDVASRTMQPLLTFGLGAILALHPAIGLGADPVTIAGLARIEPRGGVVELAAPSSALNARIAKLLVGDGDTIQAGQPVAILDNADVLEAEAQLAAATVDQAKARLWVARRKQDRMDQLGQEPKIKSLDDLDATLGRLGEAQAEVKEAEAFYLRQKKLADDAVIRAPLNATVLAVHAHVGERASASPGIMELADTSRMYAVAEVYETDIRFVEPGQQATFKSDALSEPVEGQVERVQRLVRPTGLSAVSPARDRDARVVKVYIILNTPKVVSRFIHLQGEVLIHTRLPPSAADDRRLRSGAP